MFVDSPIRNNKVFIYLRVSTAKQDLDSQIMEIKNYCIKNDLVPPEDNIYLDKGISGTVPWRKRKLNDIIEKLKKNDTIIVPEISRLGRNMFENNEIFGICKNRNVKVIIIKNNMVFDGSFNSGVMVNLYSVFAEFERNIISERTKQGLLVAKEKGHLTGRKRGKRKNKLDIHIDDISNLIKQGKTTYDISANYKVANTHLINFMKNNNLMELYNSNDIYSTRKSYSREKRILKEKHLSNNSNTVN
jgi:DNA invertase Pin-like site-specific DNA recombinase